jgi:glycerol uptake facilitator-like aquaporin
MDMPRRLGAEFFGTFWLTFAGCGSAVLAAGFPTLGIGFLGVSFAFGLTVLTMAYAVGHVSGGHFNSAVTVGLWAGGRFKAADVIPYIIAQWVPSWRLQFSTQSPQANPAGSPAGSHPTATAISARANTAWGPAF